jgi:hypothetical protein
MRCTSTAYHIFDKDKQQISLVQALKMANFRGSPTPYRGDRSKATLRSPGPGHSGDVENRDSTRKINGTVDKLLNFEKKRDADTALKKLLNPRVAHPV